MATGSKYDRTIEAKYKDENIVTDVYRVLDAFDVKSQPRGHAAKKVLCAGLRGKGDEFNDIVEAVDALLEDAEITRRKTAAILSPKHRRRLETLRRAEDIFELLKKTLEAYMLAKAGNADEAIICAANKTVDAIESAGKPEITSEASRQRGGLLPN